MGVKAVEHVEFSVEYWSQILETPVEKIIEIAELELGRGNNDFTCLKNTGGSYFLELVIRKGELPLPWRGIKRLVEM